MSSFRGPKQAMGQQKRLMLPPRPSSVAVPLSLKINMQYTSKCGDAKNRKATLCHLWQQCSVAKRVGRHASTMKDFPSHLY